MVVVTDIWLVLAGFSVRFAHGLRSLYGVITLLVGLSVHLLL